MAQRPVLAIRKFYKGDIQRVPRVLYDIEVPVIAAVNGPAYGAGCDIPFMCDLRLASTTAVFCEVFVRLGVISGDGGAWFIPRVIGMAKYAEMAFTADPVDAADALKFGLVLKVVPDELMPAALELAERIARNAPAAVRMMKRLIREGQSVRLETHLELAAALMAIGHRTDDHQAALAAFFEKREPEFEGT